MKLYKGFDKDLKCGDFKFEVGKEYEEAEADICRKGFHACENPLDVFNYYPPSASRYCEVDLDVNEQTKSSDTKRFGNKIKINAEIGLPGIIKAGVEYIKEHVDWENSEKSNTGYRSAATNTGYRSAATNTGDWSAATNTGDWSAATNTGYRSAATNTGYRSAATNTGDWSAATNTGNQSASTNTGNWSAATNTGDWSAATNTGNQSAAIASGNWSAATNTGYQSAAIASGNWSAATNTGYRSAATNTGNQSAAIASGNWSAAIVSGKESVAISTGYRGKAKGALGCFIVLAEWKIINGDYHLIDVKSAKVDGEKIKPDIFYELIDGKIVEAK